MTNYLIDTQILIRAFRSPAVAESLDAFLTGARVFLSSVVAHELLSGARPDELRRLRREFLDPFEAVNRLANPTYRGWTEAGDIVRKMSEEGYQITRSLANDALIAVSAAQIGAVVFHDNVRDFAAIKRHYPKFEHVRAWPPFLAN